MDSTERRPLLSDERRLAVPAGPAAAREPRRFPRMLAPAALPNRLFGRLGALSPPLKRWLWRSWYELLAGQFPQADWTFMNYGYAVTDPGAAAASHPGR